MVKWHFTVSGRTKEHVKLAQRKELITKQPDLEDAATTQKIADAVDAILDLVPQAPSQLLVVEATGCLDDDRSLVNLKIQTTPLCSGS